MPLITLIVVLAIIALLLAFIPNMDYRLRILFIVVAVAAVIFWLLGYMPDFPFTERHTTHEVIVP